MKEKLYKILKYVVSAVLALTLLYVSFRKVNWTEFWEQLLLCNWFLIACSMLAGAAAFWIRGVRWKQILLPLDPGTKVLTTINGVNISNVANMVIPFSGEFVRSGIVAKHSKVTYDRALGTAALERVWDVVTVIIFLFVLLIFKRDVFGDYLLNKVWMPLVGRFHASVWLIVALVVGLLAYFFWAVKHYSERSRVCARIHGVLHRLLEGFGSCFRMKKKGLFFIYTVLIWSMYWLQMVFVTSAMPSVSGLGLIDALFLMLIGSFASVIPTPGGFGAYHYLVSVAMATIYGFPQAGIGIVYATISHESQAVTMLLTGLGSYISETLRRD